MWVIFQTDPLPKPHTGREALWRISTIAARDIQLSGKQNSVDSFLTGAAKTRPTEPGKIIQSDLKQVGPSRGLGRFLPPHRKGQRPGDLFAIRDKVVISP